MSWTSCFATAPSQSWADANTEQYPEQGRDRAILSSSCSCPTHSQVESWGGDLEQPNPGAPQPWSPEGSLPPAGRDAPATSPHQEQGTSSHKPLLHGGHCHHLLPPPPPPLFPLLLSGLISSPGLTHHCLIPPGWAETALAVATSRRLSSNFLPGQHEFALGSPKPSLNSPDIVNSEVVTTLPSASVSPMACQMPQIHQREGELMAERINKPHHTQPLSFLRPL